MRLVRKPQSTGELLAQLTAAAALANTGWEYWRRYQAWKLERPDPETFTLVIDEDDVAWRPTTTWLMGQLPERARNVMFVESRCSADGSRFILEERTPDDSQTYVIDFEGISLKVHYKLPETAQDGNVVRFLSDKRIEFVCPSTEVRTRVMKFLESLIPLRRDRYIPQVMRSRKTGGWTDVGRLRGRSLDSLFLPGRLLEDLIDDVDRFVGAEQEYVDRGIPWHRGYLLHGPPGTGKSSTITAVGNHLERDVYFLSLADLDGDSSLIQCVSDMSHRAILVLEDVDVFHATHERDTEGSAGSQVTLSGLLNVLDGVLTPHGLITFMTTNHPTRLDSALTRPGRSDRTIELGYMKPEQLDRMVARFVGPEYQVNLERDDLAPAEIVECLKASFDNTPEYIFECIQEVARAS